VLQGTSQVVVGSSEAGEDVPRGGWGVLVGTFAHSRISPFARRQITVACRLQPG
jgi:hypothetical protein